MFTVKKQILRKCSCSEKVVTFTRRGIVIGKYRLRLCHTFMLSQYPLNVIDLFQGLRQGLQFKGSYLGSSVIGFYLRFSMIGLSLRSWVLDMPHWVSKYVFKVWYIFVRCLRCSQEDVPLFWKKIIDPFEWIPNQLFALLFMKSWRL